MDKNKTINDFFQLMAAEKAWDIQAKAVYFIIYKFLSFNSTVITMILVSEINKIIYFYFSGSKWKQTGPLVLIMYAFSYHTLCLHEFVETCIKLVHTYLPKYISKIFRIRIISSLLTPNRTPIPGIAVLCFVLPSYCFHRRGRGGEGVNGYR